MSIYSGFGTRKMEQAYNNMLSKLLFNCQQSLIYFISLLISSDNNQTHIFYEKAKFLQSILKKMKLFEEHKYLQPKFSQVCQPLQQILKKITEKKVQNNRLTQKQKQQLRNKSSINFSTTVRSLTQSKRSKNQLERIKRSNKKSKKYVSVSYHQKKQNQNFQSISSGKQIVDLIKINTINRQSGLRGMKVFKSIQKQRQKIEQKTPRFNKKSPETTTIFSTQIVEKQQKKIINDQKKSIYIKSPQFHNDTRYHIKIKNKSLKQDIKQQNNDFYNFKKK